MQRALYQAADGTCFRVATLCLLMAAACWHSCSDSDTSPASTARTGSAMCVWHNPSACGMLGTLTPLSLNESLDLQSILCCAIAVLQDLLYQFQALVKILQGAV